jgi:hypothetical protein
MSMVTWEQLPEGFRTTEIEVARACLQALLPVSEEVVEAMARGADVRAYMVTRGYIDREELIDAFTAAITTITTGNRGSLK